MIGLDDGRGIGEVAEPHEVLLQPERVRRGRSERALDLVVGDDPPFRGVDEEHPSGLQAPLPKDALGGDVEDAHLRSHDDEAVLRRDPARGAQAVPVEDRADPDPVREGDRGRTVPGLHEARVELVEGLQLPAHRLVPAPRLGDHHHERVRERAAREEEELEDVVEHRRVRSVGVDDGEDLLEVVSEQLRREHPLPGLHPVDVAAERIDLAVVGDVPVGVGARPAREGVGGEARVNHGEACREPLVPQVRVEGRELVGVQHPLVDERPRGEAGHVEVHAPGYRRAADGFLHEPADDVELSFERVALGGRFTPRDEELPDDGLAGAGGRPERRVVGRDVAPAEDGLPFFPDDPFEVFLARLPARRFLREEDRSDPVSAGRGELDSEAATPRGQKAMRYLGQEAGAVARVLLAAGRAPVLEIQEDLQRLPDDVVRGTRLQIDDESESARVVLERRVVETLSRGEIGARHPTPFDRPESSARCTPPSRPRNGPLRAGRLGRSPSSGNPSTGVQHEKLRPRDESRVARGTEGNSFSSPEENPVSGK